MNGTVTWLVRVYRQPAGSLHGGIDAMGPWSVAGRRHRPRQGNSKKPASTFVIRQRKGLQSNTPEQAIALIFMLSS